MSDTKVELEVGDWIRFRSNGRLVIGVIEYLRINRYTQTLEVETDAGQTTSDNILEIRKDDQ